MTSKPAQGNLKSALTSYEQSNKPPLSPAEVNVAPSDLSLQLDIFNRDRSSTIGSLRDRGFTFGSEFDLGLGPGNNGEGSQVSGLEFGNNTTAQGNVVSANNSSGSTSLHHTANVASPLGSPAFESQIPQDSRNLIPEQKKQDSVQYPSYNSGACVPDGVPSCSGIGTIGSTGAVKTQLNPVSSSSHALLEGSPSTFLSGMFGSLSDASTNQLAFGQTPPSNIATSYENKHFGKRMRSGSISGRLRSMSDLENRGIINQQQKGVLKDMIISGDDDLQVALDKYEQGDTSELVTMVNSGALNNRDSNDIDILADLDLGFLNVNEEFGGHSETKSMPIPMKGSTSNISNSLVQSSHPSSGASTPKEFAAALAPPTTHFSSFDGIGELVFNGEYSGGTETHLFNAQPQVTSTPQPQISEGNNFSGKTRSDLVADTQRFRANSLAFGDLLNDLNPDSQQSLGKWMDETPTLTGSKDNSIKKNNVISSKVVGANGGLYIINDGGANGQEMLPIKQLSKEEKKAMKERDKLEKKELKERQMREKKKRDAKQRQAKREIKAAISKLKQEERRKFKKSGWKKKDDEMEGADDDPKEVVSGSGRPRSLSDPNLSVGLDENGLMHVDAPPDWVGAYSPESRKIRIERFLVKRNHRVWVKKVKYDVRKNFADSRLRVKGRFVKKEDELLMRDLMSLT